jgi:hypothetical protein
MLDLLLNAIAGGSLNPFCAENWSTWSGNFSKGARISGGSLTDARLTDEALKGDFSMVECGMESEDEQA